MAAAPHLPTLPQGKWQWHVPELQGLKAFKDPVELDRRSSASESGSSSSEHQETSSSASEEKEVFDPKSDEVTSARKPFFDTLDGMLPRFRLHSVLLLMAVPLSFALTHYGGLRGMYAAFALLPTILLASGTLQAVAYRELRSSWARVPSWASGEIGGAFAKFEDSYQLPLMGLRLPYAHVSVVTWLALPEAIDPLLDGVTAGSAGSLKHEGAAAAAFSGSWRGKAGIVGDTIASLGIEGTLVVIVFAATAVQLCQQLIPFIRRFCVRYFPTTFRMIDISKELFGFCEGDEKLLIAIFAAEEMNLVTALLDDIRAAYRRELGLQHRGNYVKLRHRVMVENIPSAWFSTSLLGLGLAFGTTGPLSAAVTIASVATSLASMAPLVFASLLDCKAWQAPVTLIASCGVLAVTVRLFGALYCGLQPEPALFSLTDGCVAY